MEQLKWSKIVDKYTKILYHYVMGERSNYILFSSTTYSYRLSEFEMMVIYMLFDRVALIHGYQIKPDGMKKIMKYAAKWTRDKDEALIFKYRETDEVSKKRILFEKCFKEIFDEYNPQISKEERENNFLELFKVFYEYFKVV